jgi:aspartyl-tRNA(Asn)/glutamyl-tRNA(Gln) amidotransferase subunit C
MKLQKEEIEHVSWLARIELTEKEKEEFSEQLSSILEYFSILDEVEEDVTPAYHALGIKNVFRDDLPSESLSQDAVLGNAKMKEKGYFRSPRIV